MIDPTPTPSASAEIREAVPELLPVSEAVDPVCLCCCRRLSEHNAKGQCQETTYFVRAETSQATIRSEPASAARGEGMAQRKAAFEQWYKNAPVTCSGSAYAFEAGYQHALATTSAHPSPPVQVGQEREAVATALEAELDRQVRDEDSMPYVGDFDDRDSVVLDGTFNLNRLIDALLPTDARAAAVEQPASEVVGKADVRVRALVRQIEIELSGDNLPDNRGPLLKQAQELLIIISDSDVTEAFVRLCEVLNIPATAVAYLEAARFLALPNTPDWRTLRNAARNRVSNGSGFHSILEMHWRELAAALAATPPAPPDAAPSETGSDPDAGKISAGHICKHGVRWPHSCTNCDARAPASPTPSAAPLDRRDGETGR